MDQYHIGPAGGYGGQPFDNYDLPEGARLTAVHVYTDWVINALKFEYVAADGTHGERPTVGGLGGEHRIFYLDDDEYLTGISGRAGWYIDSIQFHTNKRRSPLFGGVGGDVEYSFAAPAGYEITGLFGRSAWYIDSLGVKARRYVERGADVSEDESAESWLALAGEGEPLPASVIVRRQLIDSNEALTELEDATLAEAIAGFGGENAEEGTIDAVIYTQVSDDLSGRQMAVVLAVASDPDKNEPVDNEPDEVAVMVTDTIESEEEIPLLEEEAVEAAIDTLLGDLGDEAGDEIEVTIYAGMNEDQAEGELYAAVVAIATRMPPAVTVPARAPESIDVGERTPQPKDLQLVEGIGPKIAYLLVENGIYDLADLALATEERLRTILAGGGKRFRLADPTTWPDQAALGATGQWDELAALQERLKGGRR